MAALDQAWERLVAKGLDRAAADGGGRREAPGVVVTVLGRDCVVDPAARSVRIGAKALPPLISTVVLHYLAGAGPGRPTGTWASYRQLPGGEAYFTAFKRRVIDGIGALFCPRPELLVSASRPLGGTRLPYGDASIRIDVLPKLPVAVIVWKGTRRSKAPPMCCSTRPRRSSCPPRTSPRSARACWSSWPARRPRERRTLSSVR